MSEEVVPTEIESTEVSSKPQYYVTESGLPVGRIPGVEYPLTVLYCGNCGLPTEVKICKPSYPFLKPQVSNCMLTLVL